MDQELLDIKSDYIFKLVFGDEKHKRVLISLLNAILKGDPKIFDIKILNPEIPKIFKKSKGIRLDIKADIGDERYVNIEMQVAGRLDAADRAVQYLAHLMTEKSKSKKHLKEALPDDAVPNYAYPKVIGIWIFATNVTSRQSAVNKAQMTFEKNELDDYEIMTKKAQIVFIELSKFNPKRADRRDLLDAWLTFLKNPADKLSREVAEIDEAYETLKYISANEKVRRTYEAILDKENDIESNRVNSMKFAREEGLAEGERIGIEKGQKIGEARGIAKGRAEGEKIGIEKGRTEGERIGAEKEREKARLEKIASAKKMLAAGLSIEQVSQYLDIPAEDLQEL